MRMLISLALLVFFGAISAYLAKKRGRDPVAWYVMGMLLGIFAPLILLILKPLIPSDAAPSPTTPEENENYKLAQVNFSNLIRDYSSKEWFYLGIDCTPQGPYAFDALKSHWQEGKIAARTFVWTEGMAKWQRIQELPNLEEALVPSELIPIESL